MGDLYFKKYPIENFGGFMGASPLEKLPCSGAVREAPPSLHLLEIILLLFLDLNNQTSSQ
jgi:hypothetical protein